MNKLARFFVDQSMRTLFLDSKGFYRCLNDEEYIKKIFKARLGYSCDLKNPVTFNEKLNWLKLYNRKDIYSTMVDKCAVKEYVATLIGAEHVVPLLGVWNQFEDINFADLPQQFVLKTTHGCGGMYICRDKNELDVNKCKKIILSKFKKNYYYNCREWPYKNVQPRIIAEEYLQDGLTENLVVYKVFCFNGIPKIIQVVQDDKTPNETIDYFDTNWNLLNLKQNFPNSMSHLPRPSKLVEILKLSEICSNKIPFVRTDWYQVNDEVYFSEFTFFSDAGFAQFEPPEWDTILGGYIDLSGIV